jgi:LPPG:FO 2-phospho-L-lactate transferase
MMQSVAPLRPTDERPVLALSGGVGGAKLALGLARVLPAGRLTVVANTGDDFEHLGLHVAPDIDTLVYVLAGLDNPQTGWGRRDETWSFMAALGELGGETWFRLGDRDLAMHVERTRRLRAGETLSGITADVARRLGIGSRILPMSDDAVRTRVKTREGVLDFQRYFVGRQCAPEVTGFVFEGAGNAVPHPDVVAALNHPDLRAVIICPSNPFISIDPILAVPRLRAALAATAAPVVAVSPIIAGRAIKGPTAKMMAELELSVDPLTVAAHYRGLIDGYVMDIADSELVDSELARSQMAGMPDLPVETIRTLMQNRDDREALAHAVLDFADRIAARTAKPMSGGRS